MWFVLGRSVLSWKDRTLEMRASRVQALLAAVPSSPRAQATSKLDELVGVLPEGELIQVLDRGGRRLFPANTAAALPLSHHTCETHPGISNLSLHREYFRLLCRPTVYEGQEAYLLVPSSLIEDEILSRTLTSRLLQIAPLLLIVSSIGGYILSRRSLQPVDTLIAEAKVITAKDLSRRLPIPVADDELRRLALEWNNLLSRIEVSLTRIEQFTADASHELRSPIAFIRATAQDSLSQGGLNRETREAFEAIVEETTDTAELLEDLLLLARTDAEHESSAMDAVPLRTVLEEVHQRFKPLAEANHQTLAFPHFVGEGPRLVVCEAHFRRLLGILLDNALKYTQPGGAVVITYEMNDALEVRVADNGYGIAEQYQSRVFDRFFQIDAARTGTTGGSGLGLSIAKWLVERHAGSLALESELGKGTAFTIKLPLSVLVSSSSEHRTPVH